MSRERPGARGARSARVVRVGREVVAATFAHDVIGLAAELAYRFFLALFPFLIFLVALGSWLAGILGSQGPSGDLVDQMTAALPPGTAALVAPELRRIVAEQHPELLSVGAVLALVFATGGMNAVIKALDRVGGITETRSFVRRYLLAAAVTLGAAAALATATALVIGGQLWLRIAADDVGAAAWLGVLVPAVTSVASGLIAMGVALGLYVVLPDARHRVRRGMPGAITFALAWTLATVAFGVYVTEYSRYSVTYGTLAGVAILLIWLYGTAMLFLVGAELNEVLERDATRGAAATG